MVEIHGPREAGHPEASTPPFAHDAVAEPHCHGDPSPGDDARKDFEIRPDEKSRYEGFQLSNSTSMVARARADLQLPGVYDRYFNLDYTYRSPASPTMRSDGQALGRSRKRGGTHDDAAGGDA